MQSETGKKQKDVRKYVLTMSAVCIFLVAYIISTIGVFLIVSNIYTDYQAIAKNGAMHVVTITEGLMGNDKEWSYDEETKTLYYGDTIIEDSGFQNAQQNDKNVNHTIFWGDTRVVTDLRDKDGSTKTIIGTKCDPDIYREVQENGIYTANNVIINDVSYTVCYYGIYNGTKMVGMSFCGVVQEKANVKIIQACIIFIVMVIILAVIAVVFSTIALNKKLISANDRLVVCVDALAKIEEDVIENACHVRTSSEQIMSAANEVTKATTSQAAATEQAMAGIEEFGASVDIIVGNIDSSMAQSQTMKSELDTTQESIGEFKDSTLAGTEKILEVRKGIEANKAEIINISKAIEEIDSVSFQITILALNAQIEAARAGEYGLGFAVVANSIKNLSVETAESAEVIHQAVGKAIEKADAAISMAADLVEYNNDNVEQLQATIKKFDQLSESIDQVTEHLTQINQEADTTISIKEQMLDVIQSLAAAAEESASMSGEMQNSVNDIDRRIAILTEKISTLSNVQDTLQGVKDYFMKQ